MLVATTYLSDEADALEPTDMPLEKEEQRRIESICMAREKFTFDRPKQSCKCLKCRPDESVFHIEVLVIDWAQATPTDALIRVPLPAESCLVRHSDMGQRQRGFPEYNAIFREVPIKIHAIVCLGSPL